MLLHRTLSKTIREKLLSSSKIIILYGPRQVGKTTLVRHVLSEIPVKKLEINADELKYNEIFAGRDLNKMKLLVQGYDLLFIDEAQRIADIGINLKILHEGCPQLKIIATGSSSFELANKTREPLTGRTWTYTLYPMSLHELNTHYNRFELSERLEEYLVYGLYPEALTLDNVQEKSRYLRELSSAYLYKDALELSSIRHSTKLRNLLKLLAFQIGSQVSLSELGKSLGMSKETVETYIDLLEKAFVLFRVSGFSRNLRKEVSKMDKIYFYDLGVRNTVIDNFNRLDFRDDHGKLWENFLMVERKKRMAYQMQSPQTYFWRTYTGAELDSIEESGGELRGFEFKYGKKTGKAPRAWLENYDTATYQCINEENYLDFVL